jgi:phospholipase C
MVVAMLLAAGCRGSGGPGTSSVLPAASSRTAIAPVPAFHPNGKIEHVVIIIQENRSFNELFYGYPGAKTVAYGYDSANRKIALKPVGLATTWDLDVNFVKACNGTGKVPGTDCRMNGFNGSCKLNRCKNEYAAYGYVPHAQTKPYFDMAERYVLADEMYASNYDASEFVAHQYLIAAQANATVNYPLTNWGCPGGPADQIWTIDKKRSLSTPVEACFDSATIGDELDAAGYTWAFYAGPIGIGAGKTCGQGSEGEGYEERNGIWSAYQAVRHICYGRDWDKDVISPPAQFRDDVKRGRLRTVTWITPTDADSDHAGNDSAKGPSWVASLVNAVGESKFWDSTAIFVVWDNYGGWYDPEPPAYVDYDGLGIRVPLLIVSPYARQGFVSHVHYEDGSILKFVEDQFGLARLAASDTRAKSPEKDCFNFKQPPRKFVRIKAG